MHTETQQLQELKDYKDKLFQHEGGRRNVLSDGENGMHNASKSGPLHLSLPTCRECPQYGEKLVYPRKCYYARQCGWPAIIGIPLVKIRLRLARLVRG
jgi:hypothetical protein